MRALLKLKPLVPQVPKPHQVQAVKDIITGFKKVDKGQGIMPCATGKTLVGIEVAKALGAEVVCIAVPSLALIAQLHRMWKRSFGACAYLAVCSDRTVANDITVQELKHRVQVTTNAHVIEAFLKCKGQRVVFTTYKSSPKVGMASNWTKGFDLVIADEAHRLATVREDGDAATFRISKRLRAKKVLYMTATPHRMTEQVFGPVFHNLPYEDALDQKLVVPRKIIVLLATMKAMAAFMAKVPKVNSPHTGDIPTREFSAHVLINRGVIKYKTHRILTFHNRIGDARGFAQQHHSVTAMMAEEHQPRDMWCDHVNGKMNAQERETVMGRLRSSKHKTVMVTNARCLTEGVDVPALDAIAYVDSRSSPVEVTQSCGRVTRNSPGKTEGILYIPLLVDDADKADLSLSKLAKGSVFYDLSLAVEALSRHDPRLRVELEGLRQTLGEKGSLPAGTTISSLTIETFGEPLPAGFVDQLTTMVVRTTTDSWEEMFGRCKAWYASHPKGTHPTTTSTDPEERRLAKWRVYAEVGNRVFLKSKV